VLRTGSRLGMLLPAHTNSGGKALLAELPTEALAIPSPRGSADAAGFSLPGREALERQLAEVRRLGDATNRDESAEGVTAVGACVKDSEGSPLSAPWRSLLPERAARPRASRSLRRCSWRPATRLAARCENTWRENNGLKGDSALLTGLGEVRRVRASPGLGKGLM
jgi:DNA-binding IclR family transcriptional regulator